MSGMDAVIKMNYLEYYQKAKANYLVSSPLSFTQDLTDFRFDSYLSQEVEITANVVSQFFESNITGKLSLQYTGDIFSIGLQALANNIVPELENNLYQCNLFVDKVYIYRSVHTDVAASSWLWHYDNNPPTVYKIMIYLTDVIDDSYAPFQWLDMPIFQSTRLGPSQWFVPPNNSRLTDNQIQVDKIQTIYGPKGTCFIFNPNCGHRGMIPAKGKYRDVLILRVRPTIESVKEYLHPTLTTSFEVSGAVPQNPLIKKII